VITLRPLELGDAPAICAAVDCSREALRRWMVWYRDDYDNRAAEVWLQHTRAVTEAGTGFHFAICEPDGSLVGVISLEDVNEETRRAMLGYWIATPATGRTIGRRAIKQALAWARRETRIRIIWALVAEANVPSRRVLEANGFRAVDSREVDERGDRPLVYELELFESKASCAHHRRLP
jgi:ribosomal-protein-serine acetyltransferase